jgi:hypothetical protein
MVGTLGQFGVGARCSADFVIHTWRRILFFFTTITCPGLGGFISHLVCLLISDTLVYQPIPPCEVLEAGYYEPRSMWLW